jgi:hypothetical protein
VVGDPRRPVLNNRSRQVPASSTGVWVWLRTKNRSTDTSNPWPAMASQRISAFVPRTVNKLRRQRFHDWTRRIVGPRRRAEDGRSTGRQRHAGGQPAKLARCVAPPLRRSSQASGSARCAVATSVVRRAAQ